MCDIDNHLCGPAGISAVFGPQKGTTPEMIPMLDISNRSSIRRSTFTERRSGNACTTQDLFHSSVTLPARYHLLDTRTTFSQT